MKIFALSDLHFEFYPRPQILFKILEAKLPHEIDLLILAGDVSYPLNKHGKVSHTFIEILTWFKSKANHVIFVPGNHEYYVLKYASKKASKYALKKPSISFDFVEEVLKKVCQDIGVIYLQKGRVVVDGTTILGCTLWTMPSLQAFEASNDSKCVWSTIENVYKTHQDHLEWLKSELESLATKTIVITHHLPSILMIHPRYSSNDNTGYANELDDLIKENPHICLWVCGHTHEPTTKSIGKTRVLCNPYGYPQEKREGCISFKTFDL